MGEATAELNFLSQMGHDGSGTGLASVMDVLWSQVSMYFSQNLLMYVWQ